MGYMRHHAIAVSSWNEKLIVKAHNKANGIFGKLCSPIIESNVNSEHHFFIAPDGSKEGWEESNIGDTQRKEYVGWMLKQGFEDGSSSLRFVEFFYGDDENQAGIVNHN